MRLPLVEFQRDCLRQSRFLRGICIFTRRLRFRAERLIHRNDADIAQYGFPDGAMSGRGQIVPEILRKDDIDKIAGKDEAGRALRRIDRNRHGAAVRPQNRCEEAPVTRFHQFGGNQRLTFGKAPARDRSEELPVRDLPAHELSGSRLGPLDFLPPEVALAKQCARRKRIQRHQHCRLLRFRLRGLRLGG